QRITNDTAQPNENKLSQSLPDSSSFAEVSRIGLPLITVWLQVRVLPGPPMIAGFLRPLPSWPVWPSDRFRLRWSFGHRGRDQSVGVPTSEDLNDCLDENQEIEPEAPVGNIPQIELHALCRMFDSRHGASNAVALRPTCYARLDVMAKRVVPQKCFKVVVV